MLEKIIFFIARFMGKNPSGLLPLEKDERDFQLGSIWDFFGYTTKQSSKEIKTLSVKDQKSLSNCSFQAGVVQKEIDEGVELSARYATAKAFQQKLCGKGGWADLRAFQIVANKFGICEEKDCPSNSNLSWNDYINIDFAKLDKLAAKHKTKSYWRINNINEALKAIDEGHAVVIGMDWHSGFNQGGGFRAPWIISKVIGYYISGHALCQTGYKPDLAVVQNSYSANWGDKGLLYITRAFLNAYIGKYGAYANLDVEYDKITAEDIIEKYTWSRQNKINVKGDREGAIYMIYDGYKYAYRNARAFIAYNGKPYNYADMFIVVPQESINQVSQRPGNQGLLTGTGGDYWEIAQILKSPINDNFIK